MFDPCSQAMIWYEKGRAVMVSFRKKGPRVNEVLGSGVLVISIAKDLVRP